MLLVFHLFSELFSLHQLELFCWNSHDNHDIILMFWTSYDVFNSFTLAQSKVATKFSYICVILWLSIFSIFALRFVCKGESQYWFKNRPAILHRNAMIRLEYLFIWFYWNWYHIFYSYPFPIFCLYFCYVLCGAYVFLWFANVLDETILIIDAFYARSVF